MSSLLVPIRNFQVLVKDRLNVGAGSLRARVMHAGAWAIAAYCANRVLRLGGNLLLTRLLFPEAFGLMAIVQSVMIGLRMFSDIGVEASIIQNRRGHEQAFVNTAWTVQIFQGLLIWLILCAIALPVATLYHQRLLAELLPVAGLGAVIGGFDSTKLALATRALALKRRVQIEIGSYCTGLLVMILWAWASHSIWSLVGGGLIAALLKMLLSHLALDGVANRIVVRKDLLKELFGFGQWVLVSSVITFVAGEGNKLLVGGFIGMRLLAFFTLASALSLLYLQVIQQLNSYVLFPAYSEVARNRPERLRDVAAKSRLLFIVPGWTLCAMFVLWGDRLMAILYDHRYAESGHMLQLLAMGELVGVLGAAYTGLLWAKGMVRTSAALLGLQVGIQIAGMVAAHYFLGDRGVILSVAAVGWLIYPATALVHARIGLWQPKIDLPFVAASVVIAALTFGRVYGHV